MPRRLRRLLSSCVGLITLVVVSSGCTWLVLPDAPDGVRAADLAAHRAELAAHAAAIAAAGDLRGLDAFAAFVQHAADRAVARVGRQASARAAARLLLDDLVDLSLGAGWPPLQRLLMVSPPLWREVPVHEGAFGLDGFAPIFRAGEGRLRHFALAAAGAWAFPPLWVEGAARLIGRDLAPAPGSDGAADVATNAAGREFARWLRGIDGATLADGTSVAAWIRARFGAAVP